MTETSEPISLVYSKFLDLFIQKTGKKSLSEMPKKEYIVSFKQWTFAIHGNEGKAISFEPQDCMLMEGIGAGTLVVWWNGWLAGIVNPFQGEIVAHPEGCNEDRLIEDLDEELKKK